MLSPARLSVERIGHRTGKSAQALWDSLPRVYRPFPNQNSTTRKSSKFRADSRSKNCCSSDSVRCVCPGYRCGLLSYFMRFWLTSKDAVADELSLPFDRISLEMVYRGLYHFSVAYDKGEQTTPLSTLLLRRINT